MRERGERERERQLVRTGSKVRQERKEGRQARQSKWPDAEDGRGNLGRQESHPLEGTGD